MRKILFATFILLSHSWLYAQDITRSLPQSQADKLNRSLSTNMSDAKRTDVLLRLALFNILKPGSEKSDVDSAMNFISHAESIIIRLKSAPLNGYLSYVKSNLSRETGDEKKGKIFAERAVSQLKNSDDEYHLALAYNELVQYEPMQSVNNIKVKIRYTELAVMSLDHSKHIELRAFLLKNLSELYCFIIYNEKALKAIQRSLEEYESIHYDQLQGVYTRFATIYYSLGGYQKSLGYMFKALRAAETSRDTTMQLCQVYNMIGLIYNQLNEPKNAVPYFVQAMGIAQRNKDINNALIIMWNTVFDYIKIGEYEQGLKLLGQFEVSKLLPLSRDGQVLYIPLSYLQIHLAQEDYLKAGPYCTRLQQMIKTYPTAQPTIIINSNYSFIRYYIHERKLKLAHKYFLINQKIINRVNEPQFFKEQYWNAFRIDSANANYKGAMINLLKFRKLNDSLFSEKKSQQIRQIAVEYQTEKKEIQLKIKDQSIRLLQQKEQIQQRGLQNANIFRIFTLGIIFLLLVILALFYRQYQLKQKSNEIVQRNNLLITQKNELLEHLLKEKEWLLKEVHHRVKNNLHTVICLLESQALYLENDALKAIENSQHRIYAMSLIHQKLYQSEDIKTIDMSAYLPEFIQYLNESFGTQRHVRFHLEIEPIQLGVSQAIPLALIVNEAVTNSIKYAFAPGAIGIITVSMNQRGQDITLVIADNGIGMDPAIANMPLESLGLKLMNGLSEDINARIKIENDKGTRITIMFNADPLNLDHQLSDNLMDTGHE